MTLKELIDHPASLIAGLLGAVGIAVNPGLIVAALMTAWSSAGTIFTATSILGFTVAPNIDSVAPYSGIFQTIAIATAVLFLLKLAEKTYDNFESRL